MSPERVAVDIYVSENSGSENIREYIGKRHWDICSSESVIFNKKGRNGIWDALYVYTGSSLNKHRFENNV